MQACRILGRTASRCAGITFTWLKLDCQYFTLPVSSPERSKHPTGSSVRSSGFEGSSQPQDTCYEDYGERSRTRSPSTCRGNSEAMPWKATHSVPRINHKLPCGREVPTGMDAVRVILQ
eukprot:1894111-Pyramimonas_sp.AAC.2